jgi:hypothetical protein
MRNLGFFCVWAQSIPDFSSSSYQCRTVFFQTLRLHGSKLSLWERSQVVVVLHENIENGCGG